MKPGIEIDDRKVLAMLQNLRLLTGGNMLPAMREISRYMKTSTQLRFRNQQAPSGQRWFQSAAARKRAGQTLRDTNRLYRSLTASAGPNFAQLGTNVVYARVHQEGFNQPVNVRPHRRMVKGRNKAGGVSVKRVPVRGFARMMFVARREYLGFSRGDNAAILDILGDHLRRLAQK